MAINDLIPWKKENNKNLYQRNESDILSEFQSEINRVFDTFFNDSLSVFSPPMWSGVERPYMVNVDISETDEEITVTAEMPGMEEKDIDLTFANGILTIHGTKSAEKESKDRTYHQIERSYGEVSRSFALPAEVDEEKAEATFKNGILTISLPKAGSAKENRKRIKIKQR
ncbi:MAG: Hsp20/alpha crystallin family protein [Anaerolineaceae bacterium]